MRLLKTIGGIDFTGQERAALNKLTMPSRAICLEDRTGHHPDTVSRSMSFQ